LLPRQHPPAALDERAQQLEVAARERHVGATDRDPHRREVHRETSHAHERRRGADLTGRAADERLKASEQLARRERLDQVVVGPELEAQHAVALLGAGGHHDDGDARPSPQGPADVETVSAREHDIEDHHLERALRLLGNGALAVAHVRDHDGSVLEVLLREAGEAIVVLDEERADHGRHSGDGTAGSSAGRIAATN
jgi:hypothetical protein